MRAEVSQLSFAPSAWAGGVDQHRARELLRERVAAVVDAQRALARRELGAGPALRQSLVDLASVCELLAGELPRPQV